MRRRYLFRTAFVAITAVAVAAAAVTFGVVHATLLRPLPYLRPRELVELHSAAPRWPNLPISETELRQLRGAGLFSQVAAYRPGRAGVSAPGVTRPVPGLMVSPNFLETLGAAPAKGRTFAPQDADGPVIIVTAAMCREYYLAGHCVGENLTLMGRIFTVIGVLPDSFQFGPWAFQRRSLAEFLIPTAFPKEASPDDLDLPAIARLAMGTSVRAANVRLRALSAALESPSRESPTLYARSLRDEVEGTARPILAAVSAATVLILILAGASLSGLLLERGARGLHETAVRVALGATRRRLVASVWREVLPLSMAGGGAGLLLAWWAMHWVRLRIPPQMPRGYALSVSWEVAAAAAVATAAVALLASAAPCLHALPHDLAALLHPAATPGRRDGRLSRLAIAAQFALALALLAGLGEMAGTVGALLWQEPGFDVHHLIEVELRLPVGPGTDPGARAGRVEKFRESAASVPGVSGAAICATPPATRSLDSTWVILSEGGAKASLPDVWLQVAGPDYFGTLRVPVIRGRAFTPEDSARAPQVAVINRAFLREFRPGADPLAARVELGIGRPRWRRVVGVVADFRDGALDLSPRPEVFLPAAQSPAWYDSLVIRTLASPDAVVGEVRSRLRGLAPGVPIEVTTGPQLMSRLTERQVFLGSVFMGFSAVALMIAALGLWAIMADFVRASTRDLAMRAALGATRSDLLALVLRRGFGMVVPGAACGLALAVLLDETMRALLYGVQPVDPRVLLAALAVLGGTALLGCVPPALRAAQVDPARVLRGE